MLSTRSPDSFLVPLDSHYLSMNKDYSQTRGLQNEGKMCLWGLAGLSLLVRPVICGCALRRTQRQALHVQVCHFGVVLKRFTDAQGHAAPHPHFKILVDICFFFFFFGNSTVSWLCRGKDFEMIPAREGGWGAADCFGTRKTMDPITRHSRAVPLKTPVCCVGSAAE